MIGRAAASRAQARPAAAAREPTIWVGALLVLVVSMLLFSRFSVDDRLSRDESIYVYGGQQLASGVPPYVSIVDPKTPLAMTVSGVAIVVGRNVGADDVIAVRIAFFLLTCLAAAAVYLAATLLFASVAAGLLGAAAFASFRAFAMDALGGPNPKTPGVLLAALATALIVTRRWFWSGFVACLAALAWQPLAIYLLVALVAAYVVSDGGQRVRAVGSVLAGASIPAVLTVVAFVAARAWTEFFESAVALPLTGTQRREATMLERVEHISDVLARDFGASAVLFWAGLLALTALVLLRVRAMWGDRRALLRDPLVAVAALPLLFLVAFSLVDFQGYDDAYPLLPYAALGIAGLAASLTAMAGRLSPDQVRLGTAGVGVALVLASLASYSQRGAEDELLVMQRRDAAALDQLLAADAELYALGNPTLLVLTHRTNPSRYVYLSAGVDQWVVDHTPGGFSGWLDRILASGADAVHIDAWITANEYRDRIRRQLRRAGYEPMRIGLLEILVTPELRERSAGRRLGELLRYAA